MCCQLTSGMVVMGSIPKYIILLKLNELMTVATANYLQIGIFSFVDKKIKDSISGPKKPE